MIIRPTRKTDAHAMSCVYVQTWLDTYLGVIPYDYLSSMSIPRHERAFFKELGSRHVIGFVAEDAGRVIGFTTGGHERQGDEIYTAEIYTLYVLKDFQRQGLGTRLVSALAMQFSRLSMYSMLVRVLKLNPYRRFYRKINGIYLKNEHMSVAAETMAVEIYGWLDATLIDD